MNFGGRKILMAEDDFNLGAILSEQLKMKGFDVTLVDNGEDAVKESAKSSFDLILLDIMMPKKDGFTVAKEIRTKNPDVPIIFVTARSMKEDVLEGFDLGADDYITKPFSMEELMLRINAILKRTVRFHEKEEKSPDLYRVGRCEFNYLQQMLSLDNESHKLTSKEADLFKILCENKNEVVLREEALKKIWGDDTYFNGRSMDVFISKLRKLINADHSVEIMNVHGKGFKLIEKP